MLQKDVISEFKNEFHIFLQILHHHDTHASCLFLVCEALLDVAAAFVSSRCCVADLFVFLCCHGRLDQTLFTLTLASAVCLWWERATCGGFIPLWTSANERLILCSGFTGCGGKTARDDGSVPSVAVCDTSAIEPNTESWWITDHIRSTAINYSVALQPSATRSFACALDFCLTKLMKFTYVYTDFTLTNNSMHYISLWFMHSLVILRFLFRHVNFFSWMCLRYLYKRCRCCCISTKDTWMLLQGLKNSYFFLCFQYQV